MPPQANKDQSLFPATTEPVQPDALVNEATLSRFVTTAKALSDPIRIRMLAVMARGRSCCVLPDLGVPVPEHGPAAEAICVCEFQELYDLGQSKVSYHLRILKEAGLVFEETRGRWSFYGLNPAALNEMAAALKALATAPGTTCC